MGDGVLKERVNITIDPKLLKWLECKIKDRVWASRSHFVEQKIVEEKKKK